MRAQHARALQLCALAVMASVVLSCSSDSSTGPNGNKAALLAGSWKLEAVSRPEANPTSASQDAYDAVLQFGDHVSTFRLTEWTDGVESSSAGLVSLEGDTLYLVHTEDNQAVTRVAEYSYLLRDGKLALLAVEEGGWVVFVFDRQQGG